MKKENKIDESLLKKFFRGECTPAEKQKVIVWVQNPANEFLLKIWMEKHWLYFSGENSTEKPDVKKIWQSLQKDLFEDFPDLMDSYLKSEPKMPGGFLRRYYFFLCTAAVCLSVLIAGWYFLYQSKTMPSSAVQLFTDSKVIIKENNSADILTYTLGDGSEVSLQPGAELLCLVILSNISGRFI
ncbi:MAG: hypothetical protein QM768_01165 [Agriterribacter sp.]